MTARNAFFIVQKIDQVLTIEIRSSYFSVTFDFIDRCIEMDVVIRWFRFFLLRIFQDRDQTSGCFFARWRMFSSSSVESFSCLRQTLRSCSCISSSIGCSRSFSTLLLLPSFFRQGKYVHLPHDGSSTFDYVDSLCILQRPNISKQPWKTHSVVNKLIPTSYSSYKYLLHKYLNCCYGEQLNNYVSIISENMVTGNRHRPSNQGRNYHWTRVDKVQGAPTAGGPRVQDLFFSKSSTMLTKSEIHVTTEHEFSGNGFTDWT